MKTRSNSKRALLCSALSIALCLSMLIGTTFAWFTDTASASVNKIQAGTLKVELVDANGSALTDALTWQKAADHENEAVLWEPGCTYLTNGFKIKNNGNLALKYKVVVNGVEGDTGLLKVINFTLVNNDKVALNNNEGTLAKEETSEVLYLQAHMDETAGNEYQNMELEGVTITVYATQAASEYDSNDNQYDKEAVNMEGLRTALAAGGSVTVSEDIAMDNINDDAADRVIISAPTTLNLDKKIKSPDNMGNNNNNFAALYVDADTTINAGENGGIDAGTNGGYGINVRNGATLTINGGSYYGGGTAVQVQKGTLIINGGTFACEPYSNPVYGSKFLINCIDAAYKDGTAKIVIKGGTFINFDPSDSASENPHGDFVANGYKVVSEAHGADTWYTVVPQ